MRLTSLYIGQYNNLHDFSLSFDGSTFFSVFDFDEAYNDWNQLGQNVQTDPCQCLVKKHNAHESYAMLLPVPANGQIRNQVINPHTGGNYGNRSLLTIWNKHTDSSHYGNYCSLQFTGTGYIIQ